MTNTSYAIANSVLITAKKLGISITPMQLQKLMYFTNGWHLEIFKGEELIDRKFEAWQFGPVLPEIYIEFKHNGSSPIQTLALFPFDSKPWHADLRPNQMGLIEEVVSSYGNLSGPQMSHLTHKNDTPWSQTWKSGVGKGDSISSSLIRAEFESLRRAS